MSGGPHREFGGGAMPARRGTNTVRGRIAPGALARAPELFDQSLDTILSELIQNARRAGATEVNVGIHLDGDVAYASFRDDGRGIADLQAIVSFGRSGWDDALKRVEDTAGMGSFCLASRGCRVTSLGKTVNLMPGVFVGLESATVEDAPLAPRSGTNIQFPLLNRRERNEVLMLEGRLRDEALYAPIPVRFKGVTLPRLDFLDGAIEVHVTGGVAVGIYDDEAWKLRTERTQNQKAERHISLSRGASGISFGGHVALAPEGVSVRDGDRAYRALWEIRENPKLRLVLPTRDSVVKDQAWSDLVAATRLLLCRFAAQRSAVHRISMDDVTFARSRGIEIGDPELVLERWQPASHDDGSTRMPVLVEDAFGKTGRLSGAAAQQCILVPERLAPMARHALYSALRRSAQPPPLARQDPRFAGHPAYEALSATTRILVKVDESLPEGFTAVLHDAADGQASGTSYDIEDGTDEIWSIFERADSISFTVLLEASTPSGPQQTHRIGEVPLLVDGNGDRDPDEMAFACSSQFTASELDVCVSEIMACALADMIAEREIGSDEFRRDLRRALIDLLPDGQKLRLHDRMREIAKVLRHSWLTREDGGIKSITVTNDPGFDDSEDGYYAVIVTKEGDEFVGGVDDDE